MLFTLLLLLASPTSPPVPAPIALHRSAETYEQLLAEYQQARKLWRQRLKDAAGVKEKRAVRQANPVKTFFPRFAAAAGEGSVPAKLWLLDNAAEGPLSLSERRELVRSIYEDLIRSEREHVVDAVDRLFKDRAVLREYEMAELTALIEAGAAQLEEQPAARAGVQVKLALYQLRAKDDAVRAGAMERLDELLEQFPGEVWSAGARERLHTVRHLSKGALAMDFEGRSIDGEVIRLSDYRGKVVLIDFFGFW